MNIRDKVAVIGAGCSKFGENYDMSAEDMIVSAAFDAYTDAKIDPSQIQAAWVGTLSSANAGNALADPLKLFNIPITRVENYCASGMDAFRNACMAVASGMYDIVLALGFEKLRDSGQRGLGTFGVRNGGEPILFYLWHRQAFARQSSDEEPSQWHYESQGAFSDGGHRRA